MGPPIKEKESQQARQILMQRWFLYLRKTLLESDRYVCEICNQGFQRDQNLQMHRRRHKVPWKLLKRESQEVKKRVFVCPEPTCLHHDPCHALGDLVGIKKHFRRKHSNQKQWVCEKCSKGYAVQSDYKAHLKTCGTRGHSCDCGRVFSRVESFIEHQDACTIRRVQPELQAQLQPAAACSSRTASSTSPSSDANFSIAPLHGLPITKSTEPVFLYKRVSGSNDGGEKNASETTLEATRLKEFASGQLKLAMAEKAYAEKARQEAKRQIEMAELEFASAKRIRQQAQGELEKAQALKDQATKKISATIMQITCQTCKHQFQTSTAAGPDDETSLAMSYMSSATTEGEGE
ncbi:hypothetical protein GOBAR_DD08325 [Gossypium barbadense]|nr:hypothetical protein GOBAR_DD08325 [Gossypium barbadense]